ncbi:MAG TPA: DUF4998 domain-containing protein [Arachidicoccus sp.]|nr:DUF4998 domain-containing protein [Arachidicoccus sp.]
MKRLLVIFSLTAIGVSFLYSACKKDDYRDFTKGGELVYSSRLDTAIVAPGSGRIQLTLVTKPDPLMDHIRIFWNDKRDSMDLKVSPMVNDTSIVYISPLEEGNYNFQIYTFDKEGNSSVAFNTMGEVYGDNYAISLTPRMIKSSEVDPEEGGLKIYWGHAAVGEIGTRIRYLNKQNDSVQVIVPIDTSIVVLKDYKANSKYVYQTLFKPEASFIDTFFTPAIEIAFPVEETLVDKSLLSILKLPTDKSYAHGWKMEYLWDDNYGTPGMATGDGDDQWFTVDLSVSTELTRIKFWQAADRLYEKENVKRFEVWGSNHPNADGSWESWNKLITCQSYKPSGLPVGQKSEEDIAFAQNGESFEFPAGTPKYRYLRFKLLENWGDKAFMTMGEISLWQKKQ